MTRITPEILTALHQYKMNLPHAVNKSVAENIGTTEASVSRIFSRKCKEVRPATWERMKPLITPFMSNDALKVAEEGYGYKTETPLIPAELLPELERISSDLDIPISSMVSGLLKAIVRAHKENTLESLWPPRLAGEKKGGKAIEVPAFVQELIDSGKFEKLGKELELLKKKAAQTTTPKG